MNIKEVKTAIKIGDFALIICSFFLSLPVGFSGEFFP